MNDVPDLAEILVSLIPDRKDAIEALTDTTRLIANLRAAGQDDIADTIESAIESGWESTGPQFVNFVDAMTRDYEDILPTVGPVEGAQPLFYQNAVNTVYGTDSVGKSMILAKIALAELEAGHKVAWVDYEEPNERSMVMRMKAFGADPALFVNFHMVTLSTKLSTKWIEELALFCEDASLVVIDSVGEYLAAHGANENWDNEVTQWLFQFLARPIAAAGPAVVLIDHVSKSSDNMTASGSKRKRAGITGAAYSLDLTYEGSGWSKQKRGNAILMCTKDKHGTRGRGEVAAHVEVIPMDEVGPLTVNISIEEAIDVLLETQAEALWPLLETCFQRAEEKGDTDLKFDTLMLSVNKSNQEMSRDAVLQGLRTLVDQGKIEMPSEYLIAVSSPF